MILRVISSWDWLMLQSEKKDSSDLPRSFSNGICLVVCFQSHPIGGPHPVAGYQRGNSYIFRPKVQSLSSNPLLILHTQTLPSIWIKITFYGLKTAIFNGFQNCSVVILKSNTHKRWICAGQLTFREQASVSLKMYRPWVRKRNMCFDIWVGQKVHTFLSLK